MPSSWLDIDLNEPETPRSPAESVPDRGAFFHWLAVRLAVLAIVAGLVVALVCVWEVFDRNPKHARLHSALRGEFDFSRTKVAYTVALAFICCGAALLVWLRNNAASGRGQREPAGPWSLTARLAATLVLLWCSWVELGFLLGHLGSFPTDRAWGMPFGDPPMSPIAAGLFVILALALLAMFKGSKLSLFLAGLGGVVVGLLSLVIILGYFYIPLFEGFFNVPVALFTALFFLLFSLALIAALGPGRWPIQPFVGNSPRALMLRYLIPAVVAVLMLAGLVRFKLMPGTSLVSETSVLYSAVVTLGTAGVVILVIGIVANVIGGWLEQAERARDSAIANYRMAVKGLKQARARLDEKNDELNKTNGELKRALQARSLFLAKVNHELRTPLTSIDLSIAVLHKRVQRNGHAEYLATLAILDDKTRYLTRLINDILDHAKLEAGTMVVKPDWICLGTLLQDVSDTMEPLLAPAGNSLAIELPEDLGPVHADPLRVKQCLLNLLSNANKVTRNGTLSVRVQRERIINRDWLALRVTDRGNGLTPEQQQRLFRPFAEVANSEQKNNQGSGLGLVISRELCRLMGGELILERSEPGRGSTFTIRLPLPAATREPAAPVPARSATPGISGLNSNLVLVVDDDADVRELLRGFLTEEGYEVETAEGGLQGLEKARRLRPQAITLDVLMPDEDGWNVLTQLKADPATADIPVIMVSILSDVSTARALQAVDSLPKPLDRDKLLRLLASYRRKSGTGLVLVINDDQDAGLLLQQTLEADGWSVAMAANAAEARQCLARQVPNLIVLDLMLPDMDGYAFISELQRHPGWDGIPILVLTGIDNEAKASKPNGARLVGGCVKGVLRKGEFTPHELQDAIRSAVGS